MNTTARPLALLLVLGMLMLGGCRDKHEPVKPTVSAGQGKLAA